MGNTTPAPANNLQALGIVAVVLLAISVMCGIISTIAVVSSSSRAAESIPTPPPAPPAIAAKTPAPTPASRPAPTKWEFAELTLTYSDAGSKWFAWVECPALGLKVDSGGSGQMSDAVAKAEQQLGGSGTLVNRICQRGWEPFGYSKDANTRAENPIPSQTVERYLFRRAAP